MNFWNRTQCVSAFACNNCCELFFRENLKNREKNANGKGSDLKHTSQCFATFSLKSYPSNFWKKKNARHSTWMYWGGRVPQRVGKGRLDLQIDTHAENDVKRSKN